MTRLIVKPSSILLAIALVIGAFSILTQLNPVCNVAHASDTSPTDYCLSIDVDITNNTGGTLTNQPVRFEITAVSLGDNGVLDPRGWDVFPGIGSFATQPDLLIQDLDSNNSPWWTTLDSIANGDTQTVTLWMGNDENRRDQGINFTGSDTVSVADNALIDGFGEVMVEFEIFNTSNTPRNQTIFDKWTSNAGYELTFVDNGGTLALLWITDDAIALGDECLLNWNPLWSNKWTNVNVAFVDSIGAFSEIWIDGVIQEICSNGTGPVNGNTVALTIGNGTAGGLTQANIRDFRVRCCSLGTSDPGNRIGPSQRALHLTFDPALMNENLSSVNPYSGTIQDQGLNNLDAIYVFDRDQTDIDVVVNTPSLTSLTVGAVFEGELADITGPVLDDSIFTPPSKNTSGPIYLFFVQPLEGLFPQDWQGPTLGFYAIGLALAIIAGRKTEWEFPVVYLFLFGGPAGLAAPNGWVPWPFVIIWCLLIFTMWTGLIRMIKEAF